LKDILTPAGKVYHQRGGYDYGNQVWAFCWNVKLGRIDLSFDALWDLAYDNYPKQMDDRTPDRERLANIFHNLYFQNNNSLYEVALTRAREMFVCATNKGAPLEEQFLYIADAIAVDPRFEFMGRSDGWLVLKTFGAAAQAYTCTMPSLHDTYNRIKTGIAPPEENAWVEALYAYVYQISAWRYKTNLEQLVSLEAATHFFFEVCEYPEYTDTLKQEAFLSALSGPRRVLPSPAARLLPVPIFSPGRRRRAEFNRYNQEP
jgi:hypothetical protein